MCVCASTRLIRVVSVRAERMYFYAERCGMGGAGNEGRRQLSKLYNKGHCIDFVTIICRRCRAGELILYYSSVGCCVPPSTAFSRSLILFLLCLRRMEPMRRPYVLADINIWANVCGLYLYFEQVTMMVAWSVGAGLTYYSHTQNEKWISMENITDF